MLNKNNATLLASAVALGLSIYTAINQSSMDTNIGELRELIVVSSGEKSETSKQDVLVDDVMLKNYIMENPEVIVKSLGKFRFLQEQEAKKEKAERINSFKDQLYGDLADPVLGNSSGKHVVVEFVDNNCGYCKAMTPVLEEFIKLDPEAKVIVKEFPIFDTQPSSRYSALVGTAIWLSSPTKYAEYHKQIMATKNLTNEAVEGIAKRNGTPIESLQAHMESASEQLQRNNTLAVQLEVTGTPTIFLGQERLHGGFTAEQLVEKFK